MTRAAESNAIFGRGIHLYIINMMDVIAKVTADSTSIVVSLSNCVLKFLVKCRRIWLVRFSALPTRVIFFNFMLIATRARTISTSFFIWIKIFLAKQTLAYLSFFHRVGIALLATIFSNAYPISANRENLFTKLTRNIYVAALPVLRFFFDLVRFSPLNMAGVRTENSPKKFTVELIVAISTNFNHISPEKGASRFASQYRCLVDTGKTGCV